MTLTLGDITSELKEKVLSPAKEEAEKILLDARSQAQRMLLKAKEEADRITHEAESRAEQTISQMETDMRVAARNFILLVQERLEQAIVRPVVEEEVKSVLEKKEFIVTAMEALIEAFAESHGKENRIEVLLPAKQKEELGEWFLEKFLRKASGGLVVHFSDQVAFGFKLSLDDSGKKFNFGEGLIEVFSEFCSPRFRKYFIATFEGT